MSEHTTLYGICENKCLVPVAPKTETDAVEERVTALEAGEFETVNCAGTIVADSVTAGKLCGKRVGVLTLTKPNEWALNLRQSHSAQYTWSARAYTTTNITPDYTNMLWWDEIETSGLYDTYTVTMPAANGIVEMASVIATFTDVATGEAVSKTITSFSWINNYKQQQFTISAPILSNISIQTKYNSSYYEDNGNVLPTMKITQTLDFYVKPKGT